MKFKFLVSCYLFLVTCLFLYSYTQVDLNLTLSQISIWQTIQKSFQYIGWFERPLSTAIYLILLFLLVVCYLLLLRFIKQGKITTEQFWRIVLPMSVILLFSYNAFSYDLFNYMFDARIVTMHNENPYLHKALDYPDDPWINFMRWTHRTYPYGPVWLGLTVPLSFISLQFFLPTLFLFKALMVGSYLGAIYVIGKILEKINPSQKLFGMAVFALNPLIIIETLVSGHHDVVMMFLSLLAIYFILNKKYIRAFLVLILSIGIKFATILLVPVFLYIAFSHMRKTSVNWDLVWTVAAFLMVVAVIFASIRTELQPWYMLWVLPFVSLLPQKRWLVVLTFVVSVGLLLHYVPFLYSGNWDPPIPSIKLWLTIGSIGIGFLFALVCKDFSIKDFFGRN